LNPFIQLIALVLKEEIDSISEAKVAPMVRGRVAVALNEQVVLAHIWKRRVVYQNPEAMASTVIKSILKTWYLSRAVE
jgi:hypothetical protein